MGGAITPAPVASAQGANPASPAAAAPSTPGGSLGGGSMAAPAAGSDPAASNPAGAAAPDTSPTPATTPTDKPAPSCATAKLAVCDDFEAEPAGAPPSSKLWGVNFTNDQQTITVDTTRAYRGKQSLRIHTTNRDFERAEIVNKSLFPAPGNAFFGRVFLYLDGDVPQIHCNIVRAGGLRPGESQQASYNIGTQFQLLLDGYYDASDPGMIIDEAKHAATMRAGVWENATYFPPRRWTCLEWHFDGAGSNLQVWLDGKAITLLDVVGGAPDPATERPWIAPAFTEVGVGWTVTPNSERFDHFDLWLDAVALDGSRIGCDR